MNKKMITVAKPALIGNEKKYVLDCLETTWISSIGKYITLFEKKFARYVGVKHAMTCSSGTTALHLALMALDIKAGDEVLCPTFTYIATVNSILYVGATPVLVDCDAETFNIDVADIEKKITQKTKAIMVAHLYGHSCDMAPILKIAKKHKLYIVEDTAEALGSKYHKKMCGSFGDIAVFSFFGNKTITSGEGGMVTTNSDTLAKKIILLKGQGMDPKKRYWFPILGYNYRLTNVQAALGLAQLENIQTFIAKRRQIARWYNIYLAHIEGVALPVEKEYAFHSYWMYCVLIEKEYGVSRDQLIEVLDKQGIQTRPFFYPAHTMPMYQHLPNGKLGVSEEISKKGINLPTFYDLTQDQVKYIAHQIIRNKKDVIKDKHNQEYLVKSVDTKDAKNLADFFEVIKKHKLDVFFHPHPFDNKEVKKIVAISESDKKDLYYIVLNNQGKVVGYFMLRGFDQGYSIPSFGVIVHPEYMNRGLGSQITKMAITISKRLQVKKLMLKVHNDNDMAKKIYHFAGFTFSKSDKKNELIGYLKIT